MKVDRTIMILAVLAATILAGCNAGKTMIDYGSPYTPVDVTNPFLNFMTRQVHVEGTRAYATGSQPGMLVFDVDDPYNPVILSHVLGEYLIRDFVIFDGHVFLIDSNGQFSIFDINSLAAGQAISTLEHLGPDARKICIKGDLAYLVNYNGLLLIDISALSSPSVISRIEGIKYHHGIDVQEGLAYIGGSDQLIIADVDPPESAHILDTVNVPGSIYEVSAVGNYLYLAGHNDGCSILDIKEPESPVLLSTLDLGAYANDIEVKDTCAYIACDWKGLQVVDITSTAKPEVVGSIDTQSFAVDIELSGDFAYVPDSIGILNVIDISTPEEPLQAALLDTPVRADEVEVRDGYAYLPKNNVLCVVDIDPVEDAITVGRVNLPNPSYIKHGLAVAGNQAYVGGHGYESGTPGPYGEIYSINISNPYSPVVEDSHRMSVAPNDLAFADGYLHVVGRYKYLVDRHTHFYNAYVMLDAATFENVTTMELPDYPHCVYVRNGYAYLTTNTSLLVLDVDPPEDARLVRTLDIRAGNSVINNDSNEPVDLLGQSGFGFTEQRHGEFETPPPPSRIDMAFNDMYAYVCYGRTGTLQVIDNNPPESAQVISTYDMPGHCTALATGEDKNYIFASFSDIGLTIIDIVPPDECRLAEVLAMGGSEMDVVVEGEYAYLASGGLKIIDLR